tara:strand:+ start:42529 stop:43446 length:918 start_codon:yes stop_codon:yes gene_type:complete
VRAASEESSAPTVVIAGLGLIGGSLAASLKATGFCQRCLGWGHREASLARGVELGIIDDYTLDLDEALAEADILVLATPTLVAEALLREILPSLRERPRPPVITDVASVKGNLWHAARAAWGDRHPPRLVLAHPIAGSERSGVDAANAQLFVNHRVILTPDADNDPAAVALVRAMWASTGAEVVDMAVEAHDRVLAATSHLPHVLAYALVDALASSDASEDIFRFAAGGFRDFTRIASSDPVMWRDIAIANAPALLQSIDRFSEHLKAVRGAIERADADALHDTFTRAKSARDEFSRLLASRGQS